MAHYHWKVLYSLSIVRVNSFYQSLLMKGLSFLSFYLDTHKPLCKLPSYNWIGKYAGACSTSTAIIVATVFLTSNCGIILILHSAYINVVIEVPRHLLGRPLQLTVVTLTGWSIIGRLDVYLGIRLVFFYCKSTNESSIAERLYTQATRVIPQNLSKVSYNLILSIFCAANQRNLFETLGSSSIYHYYSHYPKIVHFLPVNFTHRFSMEA